MPMDLSSGLSCPQGRLEKNPGIPHRQRHPKHLLLVNQAVGCWSEKNVGALTYFRTLQAHGKPNARAF